MNISDTINDVVSQISDMVKTTESEKKKLTKIELKEIISNYKFNKKSAQELYNTIYSTRQVNFLKLLKRENKHYQEGDEFLYANLHAFADFLGDSFNLEINKEQAIFNAFLDAKPNYNAPVKRSEGFENTNSTLKWYVLHG